MKDGENDILVDYELLGWVTEMRYSPESWVKAAHMPDYTPWEGHWNHKLYRTEADAIAAMKETGANGLRKVEYRHRSVYSKKPKP